MAHRSEDCKPLSISMRKFEGFPKLSPTPSQPDVWLFHLPTEGDSDNKIPTGFLEQNFVRFHEKLPEESVICFLTHPHTACYVIEELQNIINFKLWIAVKRKQAILRQGALPDDHVALLVFTNYKGSLKHSKTQIAYTYCPACDKTTKDYGGKKHLYSPYGTLMSDIWRDISYENDGEPKAILNRLKDLFGLEPHKQFVYCDGRDFFQFSTKEKRCTTAPAVQVKLLHTSCDVLNDPGESRLLNGDCLDILKTMPENSVDFIFADPPYNIKKKYDSWDDAQDITDYFSWCDQWIAESARILKPGRTFAMINIPLWVVRHFSFAKRILDYQDWIVWEGLSLPLRKIMPAHYGIICFSKGKPIEIANHEQEPGWEIFQESMSLKPWYCVRSACIRKRNAIKITDRQPIGNLWWDIHRLKHNSKRVDHPCQLPPALMKRLIHTFTREGDLVLDPFNGAGTTTLTSEMLGRKFIGIELSTTYHAIANERHQDLRKGKDPFAKNGTTPKAKNSRVARLQKQKYEVPKKTLQLEVKEIAIRLGRKPDREDIVKFSKYPIRYFDEYFIDWGEVCSAVGDKGMNEIPFPSLPSSSNAQQTELSFGAD